MATWQTFLQREKKKEYFQNLIARLSAEREAGEIILPPEKDMFKAFELTPLNQVKVVIIGQDPYHQLGQAHGLAFSVPKGIKPPPSLKNIYKAIQHDYPKVSIPKHGDLQGWAEQGVFLHNTALTVRMSAAGSHAKIGWQTFTENALRYLAEQRTCAYLLWGNHAQKFEPLITEAHKMLPANNALGQNESVKGRNISPLILKAVHPSPLSAHRGFLNCGHFAAVNCWLLQQGESPIEWLKADTEAEQQYTLL
ncbi:uracil-DNA glycosylase [Aliidiomarina iranensis]|uniref:Uracil-DNA glycosylase n=1 Tax=Aliidiomarina iranensis TaxID=1434071 RepID=A0A432W320_9GAMM|nr:uracil-DNA glycosylase [Aliidiomarina iranensis]RUO23610.1 uracil-DNA glycosylase [Aliidiomarina iranensis]